MTTAKWMVLGLLLGFSASTTLSCGAAKKCGPSNCPFGCCDSSGSCQVGSSDALCGHGGAACGICTLSQQCNVGTCTNIGQSGGPGGGSGGGRTGGGSGGGAAGGGFGGGSGGGFGGGTGGACGPTNCSTGCCFSGTCIQPPSNAACGTNGQVCVNCTQLSAVCSRSTFSCVNPPAGGGGGAAGGGTGGAGGGFAGGDTCTSPVILPGPGVYNDTTVSSTNNYSWLATGNCVGSTSTGSSAPDKVYRITVPNGLTLNVNVTPNGWDAILNLISATSTANCGSTTAMPICLRGADDPETIIWNNATGTSATVFLLLDGYGAASQGDFVLTYSIQ